MSKITISGLRKIIREELNKVIKENEDWEDSDTGFEYKTCIVDKNGYISPYNPDEFGPVKFGPSKVFRPGEEVELYQFSEAGKGAWKVTDPGGGRGEILHASEF